MYVRDLDLAETRDQKLSENPGEKGGSGILQSVVIGSKVLR